MCFGFFLTIFVTILHHDRFQSDICSLIPANSTELGDKLFSTFGGACLWSIAWFSVWSKMSYHIFKNEFFAIKVTFLQFKVDNVN